MRLNLHLLRIFATVAEHHSFTRAAERLSITQPAVSKAVRELEAQVGLVLLERTGRSMRLSEAGASLYSHARSIMALEGSAVEEILSYLSISRGSLNLGSSSTIGQFWLPPHISRFVKEYPNISVKLRVANTGRICNELMDCIVDIAFVDGAISDPRIECRPWAEERLALVVPFTVEITKKSWRDVLSSMPWLIREEGSGTRPILEKFFRENDITPRSLIELSSNISVVNTISAGTGAAIVPEVVADDFVKLGKLKRLDGDMNIDIVRKLFLIKLGSRPLSKVVNQFISMLGPPL